MHVALSPSLVQSQHTLWLKQRNIENSIQTITQRISALKSHSDSETSQLDELEMESSSLELQSVTLTSQTPLQLRATINNLLQQFFPDIPRQAPVLTTFVGQRLVDVLLNTWGRF